jgi:hypothetical protein
LQYFCSLAAFFLFRTVLYTRISAVRLQLDASADVQFRRIYILKVAATQASEAEVMKINNMYTRNYFRI